MNMLKLNDKLDNHCDIEDLRTHCKGLLDSGSVRRIDIHGTVLEFIRVNKPDDDYIDTLFDLLDCVTGYCQDSWRL